MIYININEPMVFIATNELSISFGQKKVIDNFSSYFYAGCYCLVGPNGSGKSSLLKVLAGVNKNYQGQLGLHQQERYNEVRTYLPDVPKFYPFLKAREFVEMVCRVRGIDSAKYLLRFGEAFKINEFLQQPLHSLSLGQTKRLFCTVTLIDEARIWILDEPSNGLDRLSREMLVESIKNHAQENLVIISEHNMDVVESIGSVKVIPLG